MKKKGEARRMPAARRSKRGRRTDNDQPDADVTTAAVPAPATTTRENTATGENTRSTTSRAVTDVANPAAANEQRGEEAAPPQRGRKRKRAARRQEEREPTPEPQHDDDAGSMPSAIEEDQLNRFLREARERTTRHDPGQEGALPEDTQRVRNMSRGEL